ncbi:alpha-glucuronidase [Bacteroides sp. CAG:702]|nr:alpha-glucuronidase [Bacteroides sp. CAG:702]
MIMKTRSIVFVIMCCLIQLVRAENGYELWLRYQPIEDASLLDSYRQKHIALFVPVSSDTLKAAKKELQLGLRGLLNYSSQEIASWNELKEGTLIAGTPRSLPGLKDTDVYRKLDRLTEEGYLIASSHIEKKAVTIIAARTDIGVLYGVFRYLQLMQTHQSLAHLDIADSPKLKYRMLNHWDNLNGTVERGYAGYSLWNWERLPRYKDPRYTDYARANASIGINGIVLNNVNAEAKSLRTDWLVKASGLADVFRPYGIKIYLTAKFSAPKEIGGLDTANPKDERVRQWWKDKVKEIYGLIPDFGGFLVKANSEGQPGPQDYGCSHAEGANLLGEALEPYGGIVFWRAFVYQNERHVDRVVTGYNEFKPLDGQFGKNVFVQPKNGPIDFQPREPFHPLFGSMPDTPLAMEFQITQENLGHAGHLVYLGTLFEETLQSDTYANGKGTTVSKVLQNYQHTHGMSALAGVPNVGTDLNWTGHLFGQANWYAFGRLSWNPDMHATDIAAEWVKMTFSTKQEVLEPILRIMSMSREAYVNYTMPLGLNHIMNYDTHNGPEPWHDDPVWTAFDYHKVTKDSIGIDRTMQGSGATRQYHSPVFDKFDDLNTCPESYLLWFHRLPWDYKLKSGKTLWDELVDHYYKGVEEVRQMQRLWNMLEREIDDERFKHVAALLKYQEQEAVWWRDGCLLFFQQYSGRPIPSQYEQPAHSLKYYQSIPFPYDWNGLYEN